MSTRVRLVQVVHGIGTRSQRRERAFDVIDVGGCSGRRANDDSRRATSSGPVMR